MLASFCPVGRSVTICVNNRSWRIIGMVLPQELKIGCAYYRITYSDRAHTIPSVQPMIYVGTNITDDDDPATVVY
jgi:hypothetical protein